MENRPLTDLTLSNKTDIGNILVCNEDLLQIWTFACSARSRSRPRDQIGLDPGRTISPRRWMRGRLDRLPRTIRERSYPP